MPELPEELGDGPIYDADELEQSQGGEAVVDGGTESDTAGTTIESDLADAEFEQDVQGAESYDYDGEEDGVLDLNKAYDPHEREIPFPTSAPLVTMVQNTPSPEHPCKTCGRAGCNICS